MRPKSKLITCYATLFGKNLGKFFDKTRLAQINNIIPHRQKKSFVFTHESYQPPPPSRIIMSFLGPKRLPFFTSLSSHLSLSL